MLKRWTKEDRKLANKGRWVLEPAALAEGRKINSRQGIPSARAITSAELQGDLFVAIRNSQWRTCYGIWLGNSR